MSTLIEISKLKIEDVVLPEVKTDDEKEKQANILAGTSIVRNGDNPLQLVFSPNAVFNIAYRSNIDGYDNKQASKEARKAILSIDDTSKVEGNIVAPSVAKLAFELIEAESNPARRDEVAFGVDTLLSLQNQPIIKDEVQYTAQERLAKMPNEKKKFKEKEQAKGVIGDDVHHVIPVSEDPSKCSSQENFELKTRQDHKDGHRQEQEDARAYIEGRAD